MSGEPSALECVILVGLQGSGKTTLYQERFAATHQLVSKDLWPNVRLREIRQRREIEKALKAGRSVVVDNTNATAADRSLIIAIAKAHGARVIGYYFAVTTRQAVARNSERTGRARVPNVAIFATAKRLERPQRGEGFDELFQVEIAPDRSAIVRPI